MNPSLPARFDRGPGEQRAPHFIVAPRAGMTLLELAVVLAILALMAAIVAPSLIARPPLAPTLIEVVSTARANAIARAQTLTLSVGTTGEWTLRPLPPDDTMSVLAGTLATSPGRALRVNVGPLGGCSVVDAVSGAAIAWDAARCQPLTAEAR